MRSKHQSFVRDDNGAMMLTAVFMTTLLVGMVYYLSGVGEAIVYRERMQDAVDAGAYSGAVLHARTMNVIVLLNMTVASVYAVAVACKAAVTLIVMAAFAAAGDCGSSNRAACRIALCLGTCAAPDAKDHADQMISIAQDVSSSASNAASSLATATRFASATAAGQLAMSYEPPVSVALGMPTPMPVEAERESGACAQIRSLAPPTTGTERTPALIVTARFARQEALRFARDCDGERYVPNLAVAMVAAYAQCNPNGDRVRTLGVRSAELGGPEFQFRTFAMADGDAIPFEENAKRVGIVTWGRSQDGALGGLTDIMERAAAFSFAQSEYYYAGTDGRELWTWRMNWRARLRRFRAGGENGGCPGFMSGLCEQLSNATIH